MQFRITTLMLVVATLAIPITICAPGGPFLQTMATLLGCLAWLGVVLTAWVSDWDRTVSRFYHICTLTAAIFSTLVGILGVCLCVGHTMAMVFQTQ